MKTQTRNNAATAKSKRPDEARFLAEVVRLGSTADHGAGRWLDEAIAIGLSPEDDEESLARLCVEDELSNLESDDPREDEDPRVAVLRAALKKSRVA